MANRRKLKKTIDYATSELLTELYIKALSISTIDEKQVEDIVVEINELNHNFILRAGHNDGKNNRKIVKNYFNKLYADWQRDIDKIIQKIDNLG